MGLPGLAGKPVSMSIRGECFEVTVIMCRDLKDQLECKEVLDYLESREKRVL